MEVAPSGDQDLCIAAGRVVRQTEVARLVMSLTPMSLTPMSLTPILLPPARSSLILRAHTQAWHGRPGQREPEWAGDRAAKRRARMHGARAASLIPPLMRRAWPQGMAQRIRAGGRCGRGLV